MKFIVAVDLEGVACAYSNFGKDVDESFNIDMVREQATREADAAARALFDSGAEEVIVWDNHGGGCNLNYMNLDKRCKIAFGATIYTRFPVLEDISGIILIGYHAKEGTPNAVLAHTYSPVEYQSFTINGIELGEIGIDAAIAGAHGVPILFVSSDDKGVKEAKELMSWIETVETKVSLANTRVISKHPLKAAEDIYDGVKTAFLRYSDMKPYVLKVPAKVTIKYKNTVHCEFCNYKDIHGNRFTMIDGFTREGFVNNIEDVFLP